MLFEETPSLEKFVLNYLQRAGALTEQESYATLADRERREKDATERYGVEVDIHLDHVVA